VVRVAIHKSSNTKTALKFYEIKNVVTPQRKKGLRREILILSKLNHDNIMKLYEAFVTPQHVVLALEFINGMSLHGLLKSKAERRLKEPEALSIYKQLMSALRYCHSKSIAHR
jgi:MAP/microtubule affinity-regulating kinase